MMKENGKCLFFFVAIMTGMNVFGVIYISARYWTRHGWKGFRAQGMHCAVFHGTYLTDEASGGLRGDMMPVSGLVEVEGLIFCSHEEKMVINNFDDFT